MRTSRVVRASLLTILAAVLDWDMSLVSKEMLPIEVELVTEGFSSVDATNEVGEIGAFTATCEPTLPEGVTKALATGTKAAAAAATAAILLRLFSLEAIFMVQILYMLLNQLYPSELLREIFLLCLIREILANQKLDGLLCY